MNHGRLLQHFALTVGLAGLLTSGCSILSSNKPRPWNVTITKTTVSTIKVDLIGVRLADKDEWSSRNLTEYFSPGSKVREEADKLSYNLKMGEPVMLQMTDPKWTEWLKHGAQELLIIADLPGDPADFPAGLADPRRKFLRLRSKDWNPAKKNTLEIEVKQTSIWVNTPQNASY